MAAAVAMATAEIIGSAGGMWSEPTRGSRPELTGKRTFPRPQQQSESHGDGRQPASSPSTRVACDSSPRTGTGAPVRSCRT